VLVTDKGALVRPKVDEVNEAIDTELGPDAMPTYKQARRAMEEHGVSCGQDFLKSILDERRRRLQIAASGLQPVTEGVTE